MCQKRLMTWSNYLVPTPRTGWTQIFARRLDKSVEEFMILHEGLKDAHIPWPVAELVLENQFPHPIEDPPFVAQICM